MDVGQALSNIMRDAVAWQLYLMRDRGEYAPPVLTSNDDIAAIEDSHATHVADFIDMKGIAEAEFVYCDEANYGICELVEFV